MSAGAPPQTPLGELTAFHQTPQLDLRGLLLRGAKGGEGKGTGRGRKGLAKKERGLGEEGEGKGKEGKGGRDGRKSLGG